MKCIYMLANSVKQITPSILAHFKRFNNTSSRSSMNVQMRHKHQLLVNYYCSQLSIPPQTLVTVLEFTIWFITILSVLLRI